MAVPVGIGIRWLALFLRPHVERRLLLLTPVAGLAIAGLAIAYASATGKSSSDVLFSGQSDLGPFITNSASYSVGALLMLIACKGLAYGVSLSSFRGGPTFPAMFLGAAGGVALSHLPGLPLVDGVAMGIGAMSVVMLRLPLTSVLLATLLLASDGLAVMPLVIVSVVVAHVLSARLTPRRRKHRLPRRKPQPDSSRGHSRPEDDVHESAPRSSMRQSVIATTSSPGSTPPGAAQRLRCTTVTRRHGSKRGLTRHRDTVRRMAQRHRCRGRPRGLREVGAGVLPGHFQRHRADRGGRERRLAYTVQREITSATVNGQPREYVLRVTQVYRREGGEWKVVHRHGDEEPAADRGP